MLLLKNSLIILGEGLSFLSYKYIYRDIFKYNKFITYNGLSQSILEDSVKYSKIMLKNLVVYNVLKYYQYKIPHIKYIAYLFLGYAYYNRVITNYVLFNTKSLACIRLPSASNISSFSNKP